MEPFKCEHSLFLSLQDGSRKFDFRRWDLSDERIYALSVFSRREGEPSVPEIPSVTFVDKETGEALTLRYRGMEFRHWATGWVFIRLGEVVERDD